MTRYTTGAATNSRNPDRYAEGAPQTISWGNGAWVAEQAKASKFVDLTSGLGAVILGHNEVAVTVGIADQLQRGVSYPLPSEYEEAVAFQLCDFLPWLGAEQARFSKNGADSTWAAVRLARAVTGRSKVLICDYHGAWSNVEPPWNAGAFTADIERVPRRLLADAATVPEQLRRAACVMLEPVSSNAPEEPHDQEFFAHLRWLCDASGALMILDEMVTFGRVHGGSAVAAWGIEPDLWVGGKCMANGMPLTAVVGPRKHMERFSRDVFHSMTHAGETLSLAAAAATLDVLKSQRVADKVNHFGQQVVELFTAAGKGHRVRYVYPSRLLFDFTRAELGVLLEKGVLCAGYANFTVAHAEDADAGAAIMEAFRAVLR